MEHYVGLDVSLKLTAICIVDRTGKIVREGVVTSDPETIAAFVKSHAPHVVRVGLETGATATWLWTELYKIGLPVICIDARHAKAVLKMQINKSDRNLFYPQCDARLGVAPNAWRLKREALRGLLGSTGAKDQFDPHPHAGQAGGSFGRARDTFGEERRPWCHVDPSRPVLVLRI